MATLQVTNLQNTAATVTNVSLLADGSTTIVLNATGTNRTGGLRYNGGALEIYNGTTWVAAGGGSGTVTGVTASAPLASSGGAAPNITLTGTIPVLNGGTGATTVAGAQANLLPSQAGNPGKLLSTDGAGVLSWVAAGGGSGTVTGVTGTLPIVSTGGTAPVLSINAATNATAGSMSAADKAKLDGAATIVSAVTGTLPITVATGTSTPVIAINAATNAAAGSIEIATLAEAAAGTDATRASTPETAVPKDASGMTGAGILPSGTTAQRPATPVSGMVRMNTTLSPDSLEVYDGTAAAWKQIAYQAAPPSGLTNLTISANGPLVGGLYNNVTINAGVTATIAGVVEIRAYGNVTINGSINGAGTGTSAPSTGGAQSGASIVGSVNTSGFGPGGGIAGGTLTSQTSTGGSQYGPTSLSGSSGAAGYSEVATDSSGISRGGKSGASLIIYCSGTLTVGGSSVINCSGQNSFSAVSGLSNANTSGAGGGSGGLIYLQGEIVSISGTLDVSGGAGSNAINAYAGGGGGGGGYIIYSSPSTITDSSTKNISGGAAGVGINLFYGDSGGAGGGFGGAGGANNAAGSAGQFLTNYFF